MAEVEIPIAAGVTSADSAGDDTEHSLLSAASAGEEGSDGDAPGPASKPTDRAEVMAAVQKQVEFYFSDANLPTDKHLLKQIQKDAEGYVPLRMIANFKRVKALTKDLDLVAEALRGSSLLSLDEEGSRVRRATPLPAFDVQDITRRTVVVEHLPDNPTIESVTQLLSQYGTVVMVRICSRGNTNKLPSWLAKAVDAINVTMAPGEFALVEFGSEEDCVACIHKTRNPDNWRTSLRVRHLLTNFKPSSKASSSSSNSRPRSSLDHGSRHEAEGATQHSKQQHGRDRENSSTGDGRRPTSGRRSSHDGRRTSHDGHSHHQQLQHHRDERGKQEGGESSSAAAAAAGGVPVHLSPIRTYATSASGTGQQQQQRSASPYANGAVLYTNGAASPSPGLSPIKAGAPGVGGAIGSPRTVRSPAPPEVMTFIDSILSAPTASTPTREGRSSAGGSAEGRWGGDWGASSSSSMTPAAAVAAALAGVSTPPQSGSPRHSATGGGTGSSRVSHSGGAGAAAPGTPTRLSVASGSGSSHTPLAVQQGALAAQLAAAAAAAAQAAMAGSPRAAQGSSAASWRSASTSAAGGASVSAPTTPLAGLSAGDAVAEALDSLGLGGGSSRGTGISSSRAIPVGSLDLSSFPKPGPWIPASRLQHMQQAAVHGDAHGALRSSGSEAEDNTAGSWRSSWTGHAGSPLGGSNMRPPKPRTSGSGSTSQPSGNRQRRRSWHAAEGEVDAGGASGNSGLAGDGHSSDGNNGSGASRPGGGTGSGSSARRSRLAQPGGDSKSSIEAIKEASGDLEAVVAAAEAGGPQRRRSSHTGHGPECGGGSSSWGAGEEQDDDHEDAAGGEHEHEHGKRRRRRHRGSGSRRTSLDEPHPPAGGGGSGSRRQSLDGGARGSGSRRQSLDEGARGSSSRRQSLDESSCPRPGSGGSSSIRPGSRSGALSPEGAEAAHHTPHHTHDGRQHSASCGGKPHSHHGSPSPASHVLAAGAGSGEHHRPSQDGSAAKDGGKKKEKKDYASWAAATPEFRAAAATAKHSGGGAGNASSGGGVLSSSPARAGVSPLRASGGGSAAAGHDGDSHVRIARMPDGSRGFGMGRGRPVTPLPQ